MRATVTIGLGAIAMSLGIAGCAPEEQTNTARNDYMTFCADCHGHSGKGDGPAAAGMTPKPVDITRLAATNGGKFNKLGAMQHITGYTMGRSESPMPVFGDQLDGRTVMYDAGDGKPVATSARLVQLVEYVERMQK